MACPKCGCKAHYQYDNGWDGEQTDERLERCAACRHVFDIEDSADEDDDGEESPAAPRGVEDTGTPGWVGSPADRDLEAVEVALTWSPLDRRPREAIERIRAALIAAHVSGVEPTHWTPEMVAEMNRLAEEIKIPEGNAGVRVWDGARGCPNCDVPPGQPHSSTCPRGLTDLLNRCEQCRSNGQTCSGACTPGVPDALKEPRNG